MVTDLAESSWWSALSLEPQVTSSLARLSQRTVSGLVTWPLSRTKEAPRSGEWPAGPASVPSLISVSHILGNLKRFGTLMAEIQHLYTKFQKNRKRGQLTRQKTKNSVYTASKQTAFVFSASKILILDHFGVRDYEHFIV